MLAFVKNPQWRMYQMYYGQIVVKYIIRKLLKDKYFPTIYKYVIVLSR